MMICFSYWLILLLDVDTFFSLDNSILDNDTFFSLVTFINRC